MRAFVAGASGAVGNCLVPLLLSAGHSVVGLARPPAKADAICRAGGEAAIADALWTQRLNRTLRRFFRAPVYLYRWNFGWLLGHRFLLLSHVGRNTGLRRHTVLEVMEYRQEGPEAIVMSAFGGKADWLRNIKATPRPEVVIGSQHFLAAHRFLDEEEAIGVITGYERRNWVIAPIIRAVLTRLVGCPYDQSQGARRRLVAQLPLVAFRPADRSK